MPNQFYGAELECFVYYKSLRDYRLVEDSTFCPPWCVTVSCTGTSRHRNLAGCTIALIIIVFAHGAMGRRINPLWWTYWAISRSNQCSTTGVTMAVIYAILSGMVHIKDPLLLIEKTSPCGGSSRFPLLLSEWFFSICPLPYNRK